ncbi:MAG: FG-GAP-like repeat-containing protein [candidate division Zixibacteria bacterium]|nr:FG-GAP-like repeat-containing protein [candidate division Zixibacteria bacterium]MDH3936404.1 FG-GAP-like repeat-containing protein [candidate division Zixibacteria bacterium]MDH4032177.1 FG-GAP-like repeat-containing protein [candidate division Zixibacteria bacterium]
MKKLVLAAALVLLSAFIVVTVLRKTTTDTSNLDKAGDTMGSKAKSEIDDFWAAYNRGEELFRAGQFDRSLDYFQNAIGIDSTHENSWYQLANVYAETGRYSKALECFEHLIEINPMSSRAHRRAGQLLSRPRPGASTDQDLAKAHFEQAQMLNRAESGPHYSMGRLLAAGGEAKPGRELLQKAAATNPRFVEAFRLLGYTDLLHGRYAPAISSYIRALQAGGVEDAPGAQPGEGDTKQSLSQQGPYSGKNIAALYGLAIAAQSAGGYTNDIPANCQVELPPVDRRLTPVNVSWTPKPPTPEATTWADLNGDGKPELITTGAGSPLQIWKQNDFHFSDISADFGLNGTTFGSDLVLVDFGQDKDLDILLIIGTRYGVQQLTLMQNEGDHFVDATEETGLSQIPAFTTFACDDFDNNGWTDLIIMSPTQDTGSRLLLYTDFTESLQQQWSCNLTGPGWPIDITVGDYDNDGYRDLYITRWKNPGHLMRSVQGRSFDDVTAKSGLAAHTLSLAAEFIDFNHDDHLDLFVSEVAPYGDALRSVLDLPALSADYRPTLYTGRADGVFETMPFDNALGHHYGTLNVHAVDFDADGYTDIYLTNGGFAFDRFEPDALLLNKTGKQFDCYYAEPRLGKSLSVSSHPSMGDGRPPVMIARGGFHPGQPETAPQLFNLK